MDTLTSIEKPEPADRFFQNCLVVSGVVEVRTDRQRPCFARDSSTSPTHSIRRTRFDCSSTETTTGSVVTVTMVWSAVEKITANLRRIEKEHAKAGKLLTVGERRWPKFGRNTGKGERYDLLLLLNEVDFDFLR